MADVSRTPDKPPRCHCGGPEEQVYGHAYGFGRHCRDQVTAARPVVDPTRPLPHSTPDRVSVSHITEDMVRSAAEALSTYICSDPDEWKWYDEHARLALEAALAGCTVVPDELRDRKRHEFCRACRDQRDEIVTAEFIVWGKLCPPEHLGPRCYEHTAEVVGRDMGRVDQWAIFDLRPFNRLLAGGSQEGNDD